MPLSAPVPKSLASAFYSSGDSNVLAAALRGMLDSSTYADYPWQALFTPLGIDSAVWERDGAGTFVGSSYLYLSARDLARIGLLMQREGRWQGRQLLPASWVAFNRTPFTQAAAIPGEANPGGHWWLNLPLPGSPTPWPDAPTDAYAALGHWGQALYIVPSHKLVIVRYADDRDGSYRHNELLRRVLAALARRAHEARAVAGDRRLAWLGMAGTAGIDGLPGILSAYSAKEYCSCRFVMGFDEAYCRSYVKQWLPLSRLEEDGPQRRVRAEGLGQRNQAAWQGAQAGCRLLP